LRKLGAARLLVSFAVSARQATAGVDHLGIKADTNGELRPIRAGVLASGLARVEQRAAECCHARADKV
jgi:hypothetical protein